MTAQNLPQEPEFEQAYKGMFYLSFFFQLPEGHTNSFPFDLGPELISCLSGILGKWRFGK